MREIAEEKEEAAAGGEDTAATSASAHGLATVHEEDGGNLSDISGYHSDSESCVMTSGNSPFISKEARYNFLSRSGAY